MPITRCITRPILSPLSRAVTEAGGGFSVLSLFAAGEQGGVYDASRLDSMFQDAAGTTPAVVDSVVGKQLDLSGRGNHRTQATTASKPILRSSGGLYWLEYDGVDDFLATSAISFVTDKMTVWSAVRKMSDATVGFLVESSADSSSNNGAFQVRCPSTAATFGIGHRGTVAGELYSTAASYAAPITEVIAAQFDTAGVAITDRLKLRLNAASVALPTGNIPGPTTAGNYGNYPLYFGRRGGTTLPLSGLEYYTVIRGAASTAAQISATERIAAQKCGVTL